MYRLYEQVHDGIRKAGVFLFSLKASPSIVRTGRVGK